MKLFIAVRTTPTYSPTDSPTSPSHSDQDGWETCTPPIIERSKAWDLQFELIQEIKKDLDVWDVAVETRGDELEAKKIDHNDNLKGQYDARVMYDLEVTKLKAM